ncbi:MAG: urea carboxylase-associated family protein [Candidatus Abyssobacteria bacterium SURF_5]|uniref:Urea carboxylase-associated family protein n=1 Tax=Abyssobacteria bacterium (strain SURF_5) TaxID=2093360 RepID=A0A3A4N868_ABYX5|nr:MAG: urea carboxylase-associated family protein [Candidatus Abyssubacteria bacterium SURF_5]
MFVTGGDMAQKSRIRKQKSDKPIAAVEVLGYGGGFVRASSGNFIRITDIAGGQIGDLYAIAADDHEEFTSPSVTRLYNLTKFPRIGQSFYSNLERPLLCFVEDHSPGLHDMMMASCSKPFFESFGMEDHPNCHDNYFKTAAEAGITHRFKPDPINIFQNTPVMPDGSILAGITMTRPGDYVVLRAQADIILILTACSTEAINLCKSSPLRFEVFTQKPA